MKKVACLLCLLLLMCPAFCWDGYDYENGDFIEIEKGQLVRSGNDIEVFNYGTGRYETYEVESVSAGEVEVYDWNTGSYKTFDMD